MTSHQHLHDGTVLQLQCDACGVRIPYFQFTEDGASTAAGLCSLSSVVANEIVIATIQPSELNDFKSAGWLQLQSRINSTLHRADLRVVQLVRVEGDTPNVTGLSFAEFRKAWRPPNLIFACPSCAKGGCREVEQRTIEEYKAAGGKIILNNNERTDQR